MKKVLKSLLNKNKMDKSTKTTSKDISPSKKKNKNVFQDKSREKLLGIKEFIISEKSIPKTNTNKNSIINLNEIFSP